MNKKGGLIIGLILIVIIALVAYIAYHYDEYKLRYTKITKDNYQQIIVDISKSALSDLEKSTAVAKITENVSNFEVIDGKTVDDLIDDGKGFFEKVFEKISSVFD